MTDILSPVMNTSPKDRFEALCAMALSRPSIIAEKVTPPLRIVKLSRCAIVGYFAWGEKLEHELHEYMVEG